MVAWDEMRVLKGFCRFAANPDVQDRVSFKSIPFVYFAKKIIAPFPFLATAISKVYEKVIFDQLYVAFHAHLSHNSWNNTAVGLHSWKWLRTGGGVWTTGRLLWLWQWICPKHWVLLTITSKVGKKKIMASLRPRCHPICLVGRRQKVMKCFKGPSSAVVVWYLYKWLELLCTGFVCEVIRRGNNCARVWTSRPRLLNLWLVMVIGDCPRGSKRIICWLTTQGRKHCQLDPPSTTMAWPQTCGSDIETLPVI